MFTPEQKQEEWKIYRENLKIYKSLLKPNVIMPSSDLPENLRPNFFATGNPYTNVLAFCIHDIRHKIQMSLEGKEHLVENGFIVVDILGSDGCDGAAGY